jgi:hypothetical protein
VSADAADLSVALVGWNSAEALASCFDALAASAAAAGAQLDVVVVDNGSTDTTAEVAARAGARVIRNPLNAGFGVAASQALALARTELVLLVNPDVVVEVGFVGAVVRAAAELPEDVATLVPDVRFAEDPNRVNVRGILIDELGIPAEAGAGEAAVELPGRVEVFGGSSGACVLRLDALRRVAGLEPAFFAYLEDVDLAWRLQELGLRAMLLPDALAYHEGSASAGEGSPLKSFLVARNRRILFRLHDPPGTRKRAWRAATEAGHAAWSTVASRSPAAVVGRLDALRLRRYVRFVRASRYAAGEPVGRPVAFAPRVPFAQALRRKRRAKMLMKTR